MSGAPIDQAVLVDELASGWLAGADPTTALPAARQLVADWAREADPMPDPSAVVRYQREALEATTARTGGDRLKGLEVELLRRQLDQLGAATFKLAKEAADNTIRPEDSRREGQALLERCETIAAGLDRFETDPVTEAMRQSLGDAMLDALYAVERKAMSLRLAHARPDAGDAAPDLTR